jgi:hypothetical protein
MWSIVHTLRGSAHSFSRSPTRAVGWSQKPLEDAGWYNSLAKKAHLKGPGDFKEVRSPAVLVVADLSDPLDELAVELFLDGNVRHGRGCRSAVPMLLTWREPDHVARSDFLDRASPALR